ncbi:type II secretion system F family protein [Candidatus Wolfebacteria bacterium]|nr:type II secretion system F family protein [Candidatus Wolfebacteria bacterium]
MKYKYTARTTEGELQTGFVDAASNNLASTILRSHNLFILSMEEAERRPWYAPFIAWANRVRMSDLMIFTRQFATLLESKVPLADSMQSLYRQTTNPVLKEAIFQIATDINAGLSVSQSLERQSHIFSQFYTSIVRSAEITGNLDEAMLFLADYLDKEVMWRMRIRNALIYPAILVVLFFVVAAIMLFTVFPQIEPIFAETNVSLPFLTRTFLATGHFIAEWWWALSFIFILFVLLIVDYIRSDEGKVVANELLMQVPVLGNIFKKMYVARFAEALRVLMKGAIPLTQAIEVAGHSIQNLIYRDLLHEVAEGVKRGEPLSVMLREHEVYFPAMVNQMVAVGETTGRLEETLGRIASVYTREVNNLLDNLMELLQPILVAVIGVFVGLLFASILIPIYDLAKSF